MMFQVLTAVKFSMLVFWVVTLSGLVSRYRGFGGTCCFYLQGYSSETLVPTFKSSPRYNVEDRNRQSEFIAFTCVHIYISCIDISDLKKGMELKTLR